MSSLTTLAIPLLLLGHLLLGLIERGETSSSSSSSSNLEGMSMPGACNPTSPLCSASAVEVSGCAIAAMIAQLPLNKPAASERPSNECFDINLLDFCVQVVNGINYMFTAEVTLKQTPACQQHKHECSILTAKIYEAPQSSLTDNGNLISCGNGRKFLIQKASWSASSPSNCGDSLSPVTCPVNLLPSVPTDPIPPPPPPYVGSMQQHSLESSADKRRLGQVSFVPNLRKMRKVRKMRKGLKPKSALPPTSTPTSIPTTAPSGGPRTSSPYPNTRAPTEATGSMRRLLQYTSQSMSQGDDRIFDDDDDDLIADDDDLFGDDANDDGTMIVSSTISQCEYSCEY